MDYKSTMTLKYVFFLQYSWIDTMVLYGRHHDLVHRYIHISNDNGPYSFYVEFFIPLTLPRLYRTLLCI